MLRHLLIVLLAVIIGFVLVGQAPVSQRRVERFAYRQALPIGLTNGPTVIRYLATTRRWRTAGLLVGLVVAGVGPAVRGTVHLSGLGMFAGWFIGAVIAEWRVSTLSSGSRRIATLRPRRLSDYLSWPARCLPILWFLLLVAGTTTELIASVVLRPGHVAIMTFWLAASVLLASAFLFIQRHILCRPQRPGSAEDQVTDNAIRSRSLHVLGGSAIAIASYAATLVQSQGSPWLQNSYDGPAALALFTLAVLGPLIGFKVATSPANLTRSDQPAVGVPLSQ